MPENNDALLKIPQLLLVHNDNWEFRGTAYADVVRVEYWETISDKTEKRSQFEVPTFCAKQLFIELAKLADDAPEE